LVQLGRWSWPGLPVNSHREAAREDITTLYGRPRRQPLDPPACKICDETFEIAGRIGWLGKADVLDDLHKERYKRLTTVNSSLHMLPAFVVTAQNIYLSGHSNSYLLISRTTRQGRHREQISREKYRWQGRLFLLLYSWQ
jgi:hypothetical protein